MYIRYLVYPLPRMPVTNEGFVVGIPKPKNVLSCHPGGDWISGLWVDPSYTRPYHWFIGILLVAYQENPIYNWVVFHPLNIAKNKDQLVTAHIVHRLGVTPSQYQWQMKANRDPRTQTCFRILVVTGIRHRERGPHPIHRAPTRHVHHLAPASARSITFTSPVLANSSKVGYGLYQIGFYSN